MRDPVWVLSSCKRRFGDLDEVVQLLYDVKVRELNLVEQLYGLLYNYFKGENTAMKRAFVI